MKQILEMGRIKTTKNQQKKHYLQMGNSEKQYLKNKIDNIDLTKITISNHLLIKNSRNQTNYNKDDIIQTLQNKNYNIIEYNEVEGEKNDCRVLVRSIATSLIEFTDKNTLNKTKEKANICFVISLINLRIITAYWNKESDNHKNIVWSRYNNNLEIIKRGNKHE